MSQLKQSDNANKPSETKPIVPLSVPSEPDADPEVQLPKADVASASILPPKPHWADADDSDQNVPFNLWGDVVAQHKAEQEAIKQTKLNMEQEYQAQFVAEAALQSAAGREVKQSEAEAVPVAGPNIPNSFVHGYSSDLDPSAFGNRQKGKDRWSRASSSSAVSGAEGLNEIVEAAKRGLKSQAVAAEAGIDKSAMSWSSFQKNVADPRLMEAERERRGERSKNQGPLATTGMSYPPVVSN